MFLATRTSLFGHQMAMGALCDSFQSALIRTQATQPPYPPPPLQPAGVAPFSLQDKKKRLQSILIVLRGTIRCSPQTQATRGLVSFLFDWLGKLWSLRLAESTIENIKRRLWGRTCQVCVCRCLLVAAVCLFEQDQKFCRRSSGQRAC